MTSCTTIGHPVTLSSYLEISNAMIHYRIRIQEALDACWADWLAPLVSHQAAGNETVLTGALRDQAELFGLLVKVRDLNLTLLSVERIEAEGEVGAIALRSRSRE